MRMLINKDDLDQYYNMAEVIHLAYNLFINQNALVMKKNVGLMDQSFRVVLSLLLSGLIVSSIAVGVWAKIFTIACFVLLTTTVMGKCPLYSFFGISTRSESQSS